MFIQQCTASCKLGSEQLSLVLLKRTVFLTLGWNLAVRPLKLNDLIWQLGSAQYHAHFLIPGKKIAQTSPNHLLEHDAKIPTHSFSMKASTQTNKQKICVNRQQLTQPDTITRRYDQRPSIYYFSKRLWWMGSKTGSFC